CRRYKLSAEVREAAERALKRFQSIRCTATKEELAQTQALVAVHQRQASSKEAANRSKQPVQLVPPSNHVDLTTTTDIPVVGAINSCPPTTINSVASAPPATTAAVASSVDKSDSPLNRNSSGLSSDEGLKSISADLDAKVDDVLSRIRAAEERMAAAALATTSSSTTNRPGFMHISDKAFGNGHTIRASAVAAAAAHIRDEEDEESVMSRVEQVAAYQAAAASKVSTLPAAVKVEIPSSFSSPPPPPPPPPIPLQSLKSSSPLRPPSPLPVDLDLDSRIERLITRPAPVVDNVPPPPPPPPTPPPPPAPQRMRTDNGHTSHLPAALLARRRTIANKLAAAKALGSAASHDVVDSTASTAAEPKGDDEIYDLLGV
ncbi:putative hepatoma derived growth factor, partial [Fasciola gigantica]